MPSDERVKQALEVVSGRIENFRSSIAVTAEQVRGFLSTHRPSENGQVSRIRAELGLFGTDRIDAERFAALLDTDSPTDSITIERIEQALDTLSKMGARKSDFFVVRVETGGHLRDTVARRLDELGRAFGAARVVNLSKTGKYQHSDHATLLESLPFSRWRKAERDVAPPLVVDVDGTDLTVAGLAEFLDGCQKIVLAVRGEAPAAPLVRLVSPGVLVIQTANVDDLAGIAAWEGPAVVALVSESAAHFVHDPRGGDHLCDRLNVSSVPDDKPRHALGGISVFQQVEDLRQLVSMTSQPRPRAAEASGTATASEPASADPADKLAAWLLSQANLPDH